MKLFKFSIILIALAMLIALTGNIMADQVVPAVPGLQGITTSVVVDIDGIVTDSNAIGWQLSDQELAPRGGQVNVFSWGPDSYYDNIIEIWPYMLDFGQTQYSTTYDSSTVAQHGHTNLIKTMTVDTGNKILTQSNVKANSETTFIATGNGGNILGTDNIMIDGAGMPTSASDRMICPFGSLDETWAYNTIPASCNIVTAGSNYDLNIGSVVTSANDRFIGTDATMPVVLNYATNVKPYTIVGQGTFPAMGSTSAYVKAFINEGRDPYYWADFIEPIEPDGDLLIMVHVYDKNEELTYSDSISGSGVINSFSKTIAYQSGKAILP